MTASRFSRLAFGGGEAGEAAAHSALMAHEASLVPGARVRVYRGEPAGLVGVVIGDGPGRTVRVDAGDGLTCTLETRNVELVASRQIEREPRILTTFETITPESAEQGDLADQGFIDDEGESMVPDENDIYDGFNVADKAARFLRDNGATEASSTHFHPGIWYTAYETRTNYHTGETEDRSYHLEEFTPEEEREVFELMKSRR